MKRTMWLVAMLAVAGIAGKAIAGIEIVNEDDKAYEIVIKCGGYETGDTIYQNVRSMKSYPGDNCNLMLKGAEGGPKIQDGAEYIIKKGSLYQK